MLPFRKNKRGFTLIEMIFVLAIIAILASIAIPYFEGIKNETKLTRVETELAMLKNSLESYYQFKGQFPSNISTDLQATTPKILSKILADPFKTDGSTNPATYGYEPGDVWYVIYSKGLDPISKNWTLETIGGQLSIKKNSGCLNVIDSNLPITE